MTKITVLILHEAMCTFTGQISPLIIHRMKNMSDKIRRRKQKKKSFVFCNFICLEYRAVYEIMWKNIAQPA